MAAYLAEENVFLGYRRWRHRSDRCEGHGGGLRPGPPRPRRGCRAPPAQQRGRPAERGLLHDWQQRNREASLPLALRQLEAAGNLGNLRLAIAGGSEGYRGPVFMDSDIYKTLEAIGWELARGAAHGAGRVRRRDDRAAGEGAAAGRLPELLHPGHRPAPVRATWPTATSCTAPGHLIQAAVAQPARRRDAAGCSAWPAGSPTTWSGFLGQQEGLDGHPIVETALVELYRETGHAALPAAGQPVPRAARPRADRRLRLRQPLPAGPPAGPGDDQPRSGTRSGRCTWRPGVVDVAAETGDAELLAASVTRWDDMVATKTYLTGGVGSRHDGESFGDRLRAAAGPGLQRDLRVDRQLPVELAAAAGHRRGQVRRPMERVLYNGFAGAISTDGHPVLLRQPAAAARGPLRERRARAAPGVVLLRLLPAEHHAARRLAGALPGHGGRRHPAPAPVHRGDMAAPAGRRHPRRRHGHRLPLVRRGRACG